MGTHISKVKSVSLDGWYPYQLATLQKLGNHKAALIWEANVPSEWHRPSDSDQYALEQWIRTKYERREFFSRTAAEDILPELADDPYAGARAADVSVSSVRSKSAPIKEPTRKPIPEPVVSKPTPEPVTPAKPVSTGKPVSAGPDLIQFAPAPPKDELAELFHQTPTQGTPNLINMGQPSTPNLINMGPAASLTPQQMMQLQQQQLLQQQQMMQQQLMQQQQQQLMQRSGMTTDQKMTKDQIMMLYGNSGTGTSTILPTTQTAQTSGKPRGNYNVDLSALTGVQRPQQTPVTVPTYPVYTNPNVMYTQNTTGYQTPVYYQPPTPGHYGLSLIHI